MNGIKSFVSLVEGKLANYQMEFAFFMTYLTHDYSERGNPTNHWGLLHEWRRRRETVTVNLKSAVV